MTFFQKFGLARMHLVRRHQATTKSINIYGLLYMPIFRSVRKVLVSGSSLAMTLPALFVKSNEIEKGQHMNVLFGLDGVLIMSKGNDQHAREGLLKILEKLVDSISKQDEKIKNDSF